jgi:hypothetical protein
MQRGASSSSFAVFAIDHRFLGADSRRSGYSMLEHANKDMEHQTVHKFKNFSGAMALCVLQQAGPVTPQELINGDLVMQASVVYESGSQCSSLIAPSDSASHAGVSNGAMAITSAGSFSERPPEQGYFWCKKCKLQKPLAHLRARGNSKICFSDVNSYAALAARWKRNKKLRDWWHGLTDDEQAVWYRRQQENGFGTKRKFDAVYYEENTVATAETNEFAVDEYIPWRIFARRAIADGFNRQQAAAEFARIVADRRFLCKFRRGEWHVPDYQGIRETRGTRNTVSTALRRATIVDNADQMSELIASGQASIDDAKGEQNASIRHLATMQLGDGPQISASVADQPAEPLPAKNMFRMITSEVPSHTTTTTTIASLADSSL